LFATDLEIKSAFLLTEATYPPGLLVKAPEPYLEEAGEHQSASIRIHPQMKLVLLW